MGLVDNLRKATGVGLSHSEHYQRAYEKGVLLGAQKFSEAVGLFDLAAKKAAESGNAELQVRAYANARLYQFITTGDARVLPELRNALAQIAEIEAIGSRTDCIPAPVLGHEIDGRILEAQIQAMHSEDHPARADAHRSAADAFKAIFQAPLVTYRWTHSDEHVERAQSRFFLHTALASWHEAMLIARADPEKAAEHMAKALSAFRQCNDAGWASEAQGWLSKYRAKRTCWMCHREMQGAEVHFRVVTARVAPYVREVVARLGHDPSSISVERSEIVLCTPCDTSVRYLADQLAIQRVQEVRSELYGRIQALEGVVRTLSLRIRS